MALKRESFAIHWLRNYRSSPMKTVQRSLLPLLPLLSLLLGSNLCNGAKDDPLPNVENDVLRISLSSQDASLTVVDKRIGLVWRQQVRPRFRIAPDGMHVTSTTLSAKVLGEGGTYLVTISLAKESAHAFDLLLDMPDRHYAAMLDYPFPFVAPERGWYYVQNTSGEGMLMSLEKMEDIYKPFGWSGSQPWWGLTDLKRAMT